MSEPPSSPSPSPASAPSRAARSPVVVLVGLQLLFAVAVMAAVWGSSQHLRRLALEHLLGHAQVQTHNLEDSLSQSFHLLHMHLRTLMVEHPELADTPAQFTTALQALQHKLPYLRSLSAMDAQGRIVVSTHAANVGQQLALGRLLPQVALQTPGLLRFGPPLAGARFCRWCALAAAAPGAVGGGCGIFPRHPGAARGTAVDAGGRHQQRLLHQPRTQPPGVV